MGEMLDLQETAKRLGVSRVTVYRLVRKGQLRAHRVGKAWRVAEEAIAEYLQRTSNVPRAEEQPPSSGRR